MHHLSRRTFIQLAGGATATLIAPSIAFADGEHHKAFLGAFKFIGGDAEREARDKAIESVVAEMSFLARGIARDKLKETNPIAAKLSFGATEKALTAALDSRSYTAPLDGSHVKVKGITGDEMKMCFKIRQGAIDQQFSSEDKGRDNGFRYADNKIVMHVRVRAEKLPKDLVYKLTYERV
jgi:hypothetical protein